MFIDPTGQQYTTSNPGEAVALVFSEAIFRAGILQKFIELFHFEPVHFDLEISYPAIRLITSMAMNYEAINGAFDITGFIRSAFFTFVTTSVDSLLDASILSGIVGGSLTLPSILSTLLDDQFSDAEKAALISCDVASLAAAIGFAALGTATGGFTGPLIAIFIPAIINQSKNIVQAIILSNKWTVIPR